VRGYCILRDSVHMAPAPSAWLQRLGPGGTYVPPDAYLMRAQIVGSPPRRTHCHPEVVSALRDSSRDGLGLAPLNAAV